MGTNPCVQLASCKVKITFADASVGCIGRSVTKLAEFLSKFAQS